MIAVLIPVLGRPAQIITVLTSLREATANPYRAVLICSPDDPALATARKTDAVVLTTPWKPERGDYAKKLGLGFHSTVEQWIFQGATDLKFHRGWDDHALRVAKRTGAGVIGTNDLGNRYVMSGRHSTHSLISRTYIDNLGGTFDNSGVIFSEAYDHQWSDNEFVETARDRGQFAFARRSCVEHLHPHWDKGEMDETYDKALRSTTQDQRLFLQRRQLRLGGRRQHRIDGRRR